MSARPALLAALAIAGALAAGCGAPPTRLESVTQIVPARPELVTYVEENGGPPVAFVWGHGPVNLLVGLAAHCPAHPVGMIGRQRWYGASYGAAWPRAPAAGDTISMSLLPGPLRDSLGVISAGATLAFESPDTALAHAWAVVPSGPCGPDTLQTWARLVASP